MVANSVAIVSVAKMSAEFWQQVACLPEHVSSEQLLDLICCLPMEQLGRLAMCLWNFFCLSPSFYYYYYHSDDDDDDDDDDADSSSSSSLLYYVHDPGSYDSHSD